MYTYNTQQYFPQLETINTYNNTNNNTNNQHNNQYKHQHNNQYKHQHKHKCKCKNKYNQKYPNINLIGCIFFVILFLWVLLLIVYIKQKS